MLEVLYHHALIIALTEKLGVFLRVKVVARIVHTLVSWTVGNWLRLERVWWDILLVRELVIVGERGGGMRVKLGLLRFVFLLRFLCLFRSVLIKARLFLNLVRVIFSIL